jgi:hypothetical protein
LHHLTKFFTQKAAKKINVETRLPEFYSNVKICLSYKRIYLVTISFHMDERYGIGGRSAKTQKPAISVKAGIIKER